MKFTQTESDLVTNSADTYAAAAYHVIRYTTVALGWTDGLGTHLDVVLTYSADQFGPRARMDDGIKLVVSVIGVGAYGFATERVYPLHPSYVSEKLGMRLSPTVEALTELVNGVLREVSQ